MEDNEARTMIRTGTRTRDMMSLVAPSLHQDDCEDGEDVDDGDNDGDDCNQMSVKTRPRMERKAEDGDDDGDKGAEWRQ